MSGPQIVLIIDGGALKQRARRPDKAVVIWIVELPFVIVAENEFVVPPIDRPKIYTRRDQPFLGQEIIERLRCRKCCSDFRCRHLNKEAKFRCVIDR